MQAMICQEICRKYADLVESYNQLRYKKQSFTFSSKKRGASRMKNPSRKRSISAKSR
jgi:hypothetical protein